MAVCCLVGNCPDPDKGGHWSFKQIKCFSRYWCLALRKEDGLMQ